MLGKLTYLFIIIAPGICLNLFFWGRWKHIVAPRYKAVLATTLLVSIYWAMLDAIAIRWLGIWDFQPEHVTGITFLRLPIEEWALFLLSGGFIVPLVYIFVFKDKENSKS